MVNMLNFRGVLHEVMTFRYPVKVLISKYGLRISCQFDLDIEILSNFKYRIFRLHLVNPGDQKNYAKPKLKVIDIFGKIIKS